MKKKKKIKAKLTLLGKLVIFLSIILISFIGFFAFKTLLTKPYYALCQENEASLDEYAIYGTHLRLSGSVNIGEEASKNNNFLLVLKNKEEEIPIEIKHSITGEQLTYFTSETIDEGIDLESLKTGTYSFMIKSTNSKDEKDVKYYTIYNNTDYGNLDYYTLTKNKKNNKIDITFSKVEYKNREISLMNIAINETKLPENVYDIVLDPGHGGNDPGAVGTYNGKQYNESDVNLKIAKLIKEELENLGFKVLLTREKDVYVAPYGTNGRATLANEVKAKFSLSVHSNSNLTNEFSGVEIYRSNHSSNKFARILCDNIIETSGSKYSNLTTFRVAKGIYMTYFTKSEIDLSTKQAKEAGYTPYNITTETNYSFVIREVGGISTGAFADGRNPEYDKNEFYNSNNTAEAYLLEMGYMNNSKNLKLLVSNPEGYAKGVANAFKEYLFDK